MSKEEAAKIHWGWHFIASGMGFVSSALMLSGFFGLAEPMAMFVAGVSVILVLALWSFVSVVFRNFF